MASGLRWQIISEIPSEILNAPIENDEIHQICRRHEFKWERLLEALGVSIQRVHAIKRDFAFDYEHQKFEALRRWRDIRGVKATYHALIIAAKTVGEESLAMDVAKMLRIRQAPPPRRTSKSASHQTASELSVHHDPHQKKISMKNLEQFPYKIGERQSFNIIAATAPFYRELATLLLDDRSVAEISSEYRDPYDAMRAVFQKWMSTGDDVSWKKLIGCLHDSRLNVLADKLAKSLGDSGVFD